MFAKSFFLFLFLISCLNSFAQKSKSVFLELGGSGGLGSINYEKCFSQKDKIAFTWRTGLSFSPVDRNNGNAIIFPLMINSIIGKSKNKLELGIGQGISFTTKGSFFFLALADIGYRRQNPDKRFFYRITYTPLISYIVDLQVQHWFGFSIGYNIRKKIS
ncbi:MAG: hypothetical protein WCI97_00575 [Bacteroidota bacterium]